MQDTIETMQHELDALLDEGSALYIGASQGSHGDHPLAFIKNHATYQSWYTKALRVICHSKHCSVRVIRGKITIHKGRKVRQ